MTERERQAEAIYKAYPRKAGKPKALAAIRRALKRVHAAKVLLPVRTEPAHLVLMEAVVDFAKLVEPHKNDPEKMGFVPYPATFFNQDRWNDLTDFRLRFPPPKRTYWHTTGPGGVGHNHPWDAVAAWIEAGKTPAEAKRLAVKVYR